MYRVYLFPLMCSGNIRDYETIEEVVFDATNLSSNCCDYECDNRYSCDSTLYKDFVTLDEALGYAEDYVAAPIRVTREKYQLYEAFHFHAALICKDIVGNSLKIVTELAPEAALRYVIGQTLGRDK